MIELCDQALLFLHADDYSFQLIKSIRVRKIYWKKIRFQERFQSTISGKTPRGSQGPGSFSSNRTLKSFLKSFKWPIWNTILRFHVI